MPQYYYLATTRETPHILKNGIKSGFGLMPGGMPYVALFSADYIPLWKNLKNLDGKFFSSFVETGQYELLSVDMPTTHPIERNLGLSASLCGDSMGLANILRLLQAQIDPKQFIDTDAIRKFVATLRGLPTEEQPKKLANWTLEQLAKDENTIKEVLKLATNDNWDRVIGAYMTRKEIPSTPPYRIQRYRLIS